MFYLLGTSGGTVLGGLNATKVLSVDYSQNNLSVYYDQMSYLVELSINEITANMANKFDILELKALEGDTEVYTFTILENGTAKNLAGATITCVVRDNNAKGVVNLNLTITDSTDGNNFAGGIVVVKLSSANTSSLTPKNYFEVQADNSGDITTLARGIITKVLQINAN